MKVRVQGEEMNIIQSNTIQTTLDKANELVANYPGCFEIIKDADAYVQDIVDGGGAGTSGLEQRVEALETEVDNKVDKVEGKGLSTNDYTDADKTAVEDIANKVDKVNGKGLSTNDFSDAYKQSLDGLNDRLDAKLNKDRGTGNAGKYLKVGADGEVVETTIGVEDIDGGINISDLDDVTINEPHNGESIVYDSLNQTFVNKDLRGLIANKVDVTNIQSGMMESDGALFGELLPAAYVKTVKINFPADVTTYTWYLYRVEGELAAGSSVTLLETGTGTAGEAIELNRYFSGREAIAIGDGTKFYHGTFSGDKFFNISNGKIVRFIRNYHFSWTCVYEGYAEKYAENDLSGKKIMLLGDSLTDPNYAKWGRVIAEKNTMTMDNRAVSGAYMYNDETSSYKEHSIYKKVCNPEATNYIPDSAFDGVDYIIVYGGTNDARYGATLGEVTSSDPNNFCGALNVICNTLQTRAPSAHIGFITTFRYADQFSTRHLQFAQATKEICAKYCIPVFDQTTESGINWNNANIVSTLTKNDNLHLNDAGNEFVAQKYEAFIRRI